MFTIASLSKSFGACRRKLWGLACLAALSAGGLDMQTARADSYRTLTGPEIQRLFGGLEEAAFPSEGTGAETEDWVITFSGDGSWEAFTDGAEAQGSWDVKGDQQCVAIESSAAASLFDENFMFEGCFTVLVDAAQAKIAGDFYSLGKTQFVLMAGAFDAIARLNAGPARERPFVRKALPKLAEDTSQAAAAEKRLLVLERQQREAEARQRQEAEARAAPSSIGTNYWRGLALERQQREAEARQRQEAEARARQEAADRQRQEEEAQRAADERARKARETQKATTRQQQLEQERLAAEAKIKQLQLQLELERLRQQRVQTARQPAQGGNDMIPPTIQAASQLETRAARITIQGVAKDNVSLVRVELNGRRIETRDGRFSTDAAVAPGRNTMRITAFDAQGNKTEHAITVTRTRDVPDIAYGNYHALVIGINDYASLPKLKTAITDAETVAKTLEELYDYKVTLLKNPSRADIIDALDDLRGELDEEDNLLIYYAGHGWLDQQTGAGFWMPVNAKADRRSRWISNTTLTNALQALLAKHVMVVADSCYSGTLTRSIKVPQRNRAYLERMAEKRARVVLASGGLEPVADSGGGNHSVFAAQFLKALRGNEGVLDGSKLFESVRHNVVLNADQTPEYSDIRKAGHEGGDFLFVRKR